MPLRSRHALDDPWTVRPDAYPAGGSPEEQHVFLVNYGVLAPSILNTQPWRFEITPDGIAVFADPSRRLPVTDPHGREMMISCGAALFNIQLAMRSFGCSYSVERAGQGDDPHLIATISVKGNAPASEEACRLRDAIVLRRTYRGPMETGAPPAELLKTLVDEARREGAEITFADEMDRKWRIARIVEDAERQLLDNPAYRQELSAWIQSRIGEAESQGSERLTRLAGHTPVVPAQPDLSRPSSADAGRRFSEGEAGRAPSKAPVGRAPVLALLTTDGDTLDKWVDAGAALQRLLLVATTAEVFASFFSPPTEVPAVRPKLAESFAVDGMPQVLLRLGFAARCAPEARRPVRQVIKYSS